MTPVGIVEVECPGCGNLLCIGISAGAPVDDDGQAVVTVEPDWLEVELHELLCGG